MNKDGSKFEVKLTFEDEFTSINHDVCMDYDNCIKLYKQVMKVLRYFSDNTLYLIAATGFIEKLKSSKWRKKAKK